MILLIFAIYDSKAKAYLTPFFLPKYEMAVRTFKDCVNSKNISSANIQKTISLLISDTS